MTLTLAEGIESEGGMLHLDSRWRYEDLTLSRSESVKQNPLLADAERRRRLADGEPTLALSLLAGVANNPLVADAERRARAAKQRQERLCMQAGMAF